MYENGYPQRAYHVIKFQHHKTVVYITFATTTLELKCASRYIWSFFNNVSIIENFETMQAVKYGDTYYSNCSKCCPLALTQAWSRFLHCSMILSTSAAASHANGCFSSATHVAYWLLVYALLYGAVVATETAQVALNLYGTFQTQSIRNYIPMHSTKNHS